MVFVDLSEVRDFRIYRQWFIIVTFVAIYVTLVAAALVLAGQSLTFSREYPVLIYLALLLVGGCIFVAIRWVQWQGIRKRAEARLADRDSVTLNRAVTALLEDMAGIVRCQFDGSPNLKRCAEFQDRIRELGYPHVATIVDERLEPQIRKIEIPEQFLEPETILSQPKRWSGQMVMFAVMVPLYAALLLIGLWYGAGDARMFPMFVFILIMGGLPLARSLGVRFGESLAPVVAMGVVEDRKGRRWTVDDSCIFVFKSKSGKKKIAVDLTGPAGLLALRFWNTDDAGFRLLWQRWNHPHPRTELR